MKVTTKHEQFNNKQVLVRAIFFFWMRGTSLVF